MSETAIKMPKEDLALEMLRDGSPLVGQFVEAIPGPCPAMVVTLLVDSFGTKAGTKVTVAQAVPTARTKRRSLEAAIGGDESRPALKPGDVVCFARVYAHKGIAWAESVTARTHDAMEGNVQVMTAMARPSLSKVSKKGASQGLVIADGKVAVIAENADQVRAAYDAAKGRPFPGGQVGFIVRDRDGATREFYEDEKYGFRLMMEDILHEGFLTHPGNRIEIIPIWRMPMGREQVVLDVNPKVETPTPVAGDFTRQFFQSGYKKPGFKSSLIIIADEDEWAFGAKTGKRIRVASGVQPLYPGAGLASSKLPSAVRSFKSPVNTLLELYGPQDLERLAMERAARRAPASAPSAPDEGHPQSAPSAPQPSPQRKAPPSIVRRAPPPPGRSFGR